MNRMRLRFLLRNHLLLTLTAGASLLDLPMFGAAGLPAAFAQSGAKGAEALTAQVQGHLDAAQEILDRLLAAEGPRTVDNTLKLMNELSIELDAGSNIASLMENVHPDPDVRAAAEKASQDVQKYATDLSLNRDVYDALSAVDASGMDDVTRRFLEHSLRDYRRAGVDKDEATRNKIRKLREELVELGQNFDRNIREGTRFIYVDRAEDLEGLPQDYIDAHQPDETGKIKITTQYPDYLPFRSYAKNGELRRKLYNEFLNRAYPENQDVLMNILAKRYELANLLGYANWAAYITEDKMVKSPENAADFIRQLDEAAKPRAEQDYAMLLERKHKDDPEATTVNDWEKAYYEELVKTEEYDFDSQEIRSYYDYPIVKQGILDLTATLFGVTHKRIEDPEVWDPSVEAYDLYEGDKLIGRYYLDMHPREGKFSHAAQFTLRRGVEGYQNPVSVLVCNFPGGNGDGPALMEHEDVETFLHEFGHLLHSQFGGHQPWIDQSGVATEWDFVEAPSQMLEEWSLDTAVLQTFARHYETKEPIPAPLVEKMKTARDFGNGTYVTQQNFYSAISLNIYNRPPGEVDFDTLVPELQAKYASFDFVPGTNMCASFGHLEGYSAMYYTYMWSLVIAKDLFSKFDRANMLDSATATEYRRKVLMPGGTEDAADLVKDFLGRSYNFEAFRTWINRGAS
jgi:thimet oligopeptidase